MLQSPHTNMSSSVLKHSACIHFSHVVLVHCTHSLSSFPVIDKSSSYKPKHIVVGNFITLNPTFRRLYTYLSALFALLLPCRLFCHFLLSYFSLSRLLFLFLNPFPLSFFPFLPLRFFFFSFFLFFVNEFLKGIITR